MSRAGPPHPDPLHLERERAYSPRTPISVATVRRPGTRLLKRGAPIIDEMVSAPAPDEACERFLDLPYCLLLESVSVSERMGRHSFLMADPFRVLRGKGDAVEIARPGGRPHRLVAADPFDALRATLERYRQDVEPAPGLPPFQGGAAGYLAYDLLHSLERVPPPRWDDLALPDLCIGLYDWVLAWDHISGRSWLTSTGLPEAGARARATRAASRAAVVRRRLGRATRQTPGQPPPLPASPRCGEGLRAIHVGKP